MGSKVMIVHARVGVGEKGHAFSDTPGESSGVTNFIKPLAGLASGPDTLQGNLLLPMPDPYPHSVGWIGPSTISSHSTLYFLSIYHGLYRYICTNIAIGIYIGISIGTDRDKGLLGESIPLTKLQVPGEQNPCLFCSFPYT